MKGIKHYTLLTLVFFVAAAALVLPLHGISPGGESLDAARELLAGIKIEPCSTCRNKMQKQAFEMLDLAFPPGKRFSASGEDPFVVTGRERNRFTLKSLQAKTLYRKTDTGGIYLPAVQFQFHTETHHLVGIRKRDYTSPEISRAVPGKALEEGFTGEIEIIAYPYGESRACLYNFTRDMITVHCKILSISAPVAPLP